MPVRTSPLGTPCSRGSSTKPCWACIRRRSSDIPGAGDALADLRGQEDLPLPARSKRTLFGRHTGHERRRRRQLEADGRQERCRTRHERSSSPTSRQPVAESKYIVSVRAKDVNWQNFLYFSRSLYIYPAARPECDQRGALRQGIQLQDAARAPARMSSPSRT